MNIFSVFKSQFDKYKRYGGYHWRWYDSKFTYKRHVDYLSRWVKEKNTLDVGAGDGLITAKLGITGIESDPNAIILAHTHGIALDHPTKSGSLPYKKEQFNSALMADTLASFKNVYQALRETRRVIKNYLYVSIPAVKRVAVKEPGTYHVWKDPRKLVADVKGAGFKLVDGPIYKPDRKRYYFKFQKA